MNKSERIRNLINNPMTASDVHKKSGIEIKLVRGLLQTMVRTGIAIRIGESRPYQYQVARELKQQNRGFDLSKISFAQKVRDALKAGSKRPYQIARDLGSTPQKVGESLRESLKSGFCKKQDDGTYVFICDPVKKEAMTAAERQAGCRKRRAEKAGREYVPVPSRSRKNCQNQYTVIKPKEMPDTRNRQSVDEWIKAGGVIDRSPTVPKFDHLTAEDIEKFNYRPRSAGTLNGGRSYLTG